MGILVAALWCAPASEAARSCDQWQAELQAVHGIVELQRADQAVWAAASSGDSVCTGDSLRVEAFGSATLKLPDETLVRLDANTSVTFRETSGAGSWLDLLRGIIHIVSRDPRELTFSTPYLNAGIEGTEFEIQVADGRTSVAVLEGEVVVTNPNATIEVTANGVASAGASGPPVVQTVAEPLDLMRWASYYPTILVDELPSPDQAPTAADRLNAEFFNARAAARLAYGRVSDARDDLGAALALASDSATAQALQSMIALAHSDKTTALSLARAAAEHAPASAVPLIALSYAQQAAGDNDEAMRSLERARTLEPENAIVWTRLAELGLADGALAASREAATHALSLRPDFGAPHVVLGYASLSELDATGAADAFERAIDLDAFSPHARIGLALALIKQGRLAEGRRQLELAVVADPGNALARSYMAKVYDAENRDELATTLFGLARRFDPSDPTSRLYDGLRKHIDNRPIEALRDVREAAKLSGNKPIYRSTLTMDEDLATRSAGVGSLFLDLGLEQVASVQASKVLARDPADFSAHRQLSDAYSRLPRLELARVNEVFQAQLLQPINLTPVPPQLGQPSQSILNTVAPTERAFDELSPLLTQDGLKFRGSAVTGGHDTFGEELVLAGLHDRLSYSLGQFGYSTDGLRPNNDLEQTVASALVQYRPTFDTSFQAEIRSTETEKGDLTMLFDPEEYLSDLRIWESVDSVRLGMRRDISPRNMFLASVIQQDIDIEWGRGPAFSSTIERSGYSIDLQHLRRQGPWRITSGVTYSDQDRHEVVRQTFSLPFPPFQTSLIDDIGYDVIEARAYSYAQFLARPQLTLTLGASIDKIEGQEIDESKINPKLGVIWEPTDRTTVRVGVFKTLHGAFATSKENIQPRLEPVQVAAFNQFFFGSEGDAAILRGFGIDNEVSETVLAGFETSKRDVDRPTYVIEPPDFVPRIERIDVDETLQRAYVAWTPSVRLSFTAEYQRERVDNGSATFFDFAELETDRVPLEARYFSPRGFTARLRATHVRQDGVFDVAPPGTPVTLAPAEDQFWVFDASLGYRLPNRRGVLSLNVDNLLDEEFRFQDTDPENPSIMPERMAYFRFTLAFE
jgi:tetratricopeptide (TPR) repeat protein